LWKLYRAGQVEVPALRGVNFEVLPGESVAVMGPSGCGKSSLLYVIGGLAQATRGHVLVDGNDLTELSDAARTKLRGKNWLSFSNVSICYQAPSESLPSTRTCPRVACANPPIT